MWNKYFSIDKRENMTAFATTLPHQFIHIKEIKWRQHKLTKHNLPYVLAVNFFYILFIGQIFTLWMNFFFKSSNNSFTMLEKYSLSELTMFEKCLHNTSTASFYVFYTKKGSKNKGSSTGWYFEWWYIPIFCHQHQWSKAILCLLSVCSNPSLKLQFSYNLFVHQHLHLGFILKNKTQKKSKTFEIKNKKPHLGF